MSRALGKPLTGDAHSDMVRSAQIASLAEGALYPMIESRERAILDEIVALTRTRDPIPDRVLWALAGELSNCAMLRATIRSAKAGIAKLER